MNHPIQVVYTSTSFNVLVCCRFNYGGDQHADGNRGRGRGRGGRGGRGGDRGGRRGRWAKRPREAAGDEALPDVRGLQSEQQASATPYTRMVLKKVNRDSQHAVNTVSSSAGVPPRAFGTAGTKDKRGVTTQFVTAWNVCFSCMFAL